MTSAQPTFGDFLTAARGHLNAAAYSGSVTPGRDVEEQLQALVHVVTVLSRYSADITWTERHLPDLEMEAAGRWERAGLLAHDALVSAAAALQHHRVSADAAGSDVRNSTAQRLHAAAVALAAGRELLQGHFTTDRHGARLHHSGWARVIASPAVRRSLLTELALLTRQTASVGTQAALPAADARLEMSSHLSTAFYWLGQVNEYVAAAARYEPATSSERQLLTAIPANAMPSRFVADSTATVPQLCDAVITAAERVRHAAWIAARLDPQSADISVTSWHRIAAASTVTSHHCHILCDTLADRVPQGRTDELRDHLLRAAERAVNAREEWLDSTREFREITTDVRGHISPAAVEAAELALWTGRLAYADPAWTLSSGPTQATRPAVILAPRLAKVPEVVAAIHHSSDALADLAAANLEQARSAVRSQRVLVSTRSLSERHDIPLRFSVAPKAYAFSLLACCEDTASTAETAANAVSEIAISVRAPSQTLTDARTAGRDQAENRPPDVKSASGHSRADAAEHLAGPVETRLRDLGVTSPRLLWRASAIDRAGQQVITEAAADMTRQQQRRMSVVPSPWSARPAGPTAERASSTPCARPAAKVLTSAVPRDEPEAEP